MKPRPLSWCQLLARVFSIDVTECPDCGGQIRRALDPFIVRRMKETHTYVTREQFTPSRDKATRARAIQGRMSMGKVYLSADASWAGELVTELLKFPFGKHDDQVDVLSLFGMMLDKLHGRSVRKPKERPYIGTGQYVLDQLEAMDAPKGRDLPPSMCPHPELGCGC